VSLTEDFGSCGDAIRLKGGFYLGEPEQLGFVDSVEREKAATDSCAEHAIRKSDVIRRTLRIYQFRVNDIAH
jgi:hypothetical protein